MEFRFSSARTALALAAAALVIALPGPTSADAFVSPPDPPVMTPGGGWTCVFDRCESTAITMNAFDRSDVELSCPENRPLVSNVSATSSRILLDGPHAADGAHFRVRLHNLWFATQTFAVKYTCGNLA